MSRFDQVVVAAMLAAPDAASAPYAGGMVALRRAVGCSAGELRDAVQRMRWAGKIRMDALQLTPSMLPAAKPPAPNAAPSPARSMLPPSPKASAPKANAVAGKAIRKSRESAKEAEAGSPCSAAEGAGAEVTDAPAPEANPPSHEAVADKLGSAGDRRPADGARPLAAPAPERARAPSPAPAPIVQAVAKPKPAPSWVEMHLARRDAARTFLAAKGRHPFRCDSSTGMRWQVPGWSGSYGDHELITIAQEYGFEKEAAHG